MTSSDPSSQNLHSSATGGPEENVKPVVPAGQVGLGPASGRTRIGYVVLGLLLGLSGSAFGSVLWSLIARFGVESTMGRQTFGFVGLWVGLMAVPVFMIKKHGGNVRSELQLWAKLPKDAALGVTVGLASQFLLLPLVYLPLRLLVPDVVEQVSAPAEALVNQVQGWRFLFFYLLAGIAAPVIEELFFRGFAYRIFVERYGPKLAVIVTAIIFGLYHFQGIQTLGLVLAGIVFALLRWSTGRLGPSIFAHAAFNGATLWLLFLR